MRGYSKIVPQFWIGTTGKRIRPFGSDAQVLAMYLLTSPHANMIGLYHLPLQYISADTGMALEGAYKALQSLIEVDYCGYDEASEVVWVYEMALWQVGETLKANDKQCAGVWNEYCDVPDNPYLSDFYNRYSTAFHLRANRGAIPFKAPSKPLPSLFEVPPMPVTVTVTETVEITPFGSSSPDVRPEDFAKCYNDLAGPLPKVKEFTESRRRKVKSRIAGGLTLERFEEIVKRCVATPFLTGDNQRGWRAHFDWLMENDTNAAKVMEGAYSGGSGNAVRRDAPPQPTAEEWEQMQRTQAGQELEHYEMWKSMNAEYKRLNPWTGAIPAEARAEVLAQQGSQ